MRKVKYGFVFALLFCLSYLWGLPTRRKNPLKSAFKLNTGQWVTREKWLKLEVALQMIQEEGHTGRSQNRNRNSRRRLQPRDSALAAQRLVSQRVAAVIELTARSTNQQQIYTKLIK